MIKSEYWHRLIKEISGQLEDIYNHSLEIEIKAGAVY